MQYCADYADIDRRMAQELMEKDAEIERLKTELHFHTYSSANYPDYGWKKK
jgi:hypothetical protein